MELPGLAGLITEPIGRRAYLLRIFLTPFACSAAVLAAMWTLGLDVELTRQEGFDYCISEMTKSRPMRECVPYASNFMLIAIAFTLGFLFVIASAAQRWHDHGRVWLFDFGCLCLLLIGWRLVAQGGPGEPDSLPAVFFGIFVLLLGLPLVLPRRVRK